MNILEPDNIASQFRDVIRQEREKNNLSITIVGFLATGDKASEAYAHHTRIGCRDVGINFQLIQTHPHSIKELLTAANSAPNIHGIFVYYPIFGDAQDVDLRNMIDWHKDVEGLTPYWMDKLYANQRFDDVLKTRKAILPCTPLAIIKILESIAIGDVAPPSFSGRTVTIFNRSEIVGKPLAHMLSHDGALVYSFDIHGGIIINATEQEPMPISREQALSESDIIITGVPSRQFRKVSAQELKSAAVCLNFSQLQNFTDDAKEQARCYIPRVGTLTVAMCLRNAVRLYRNYHQDSV